MIISTEFMLGLSLRFMWPNTYQARAVKGKRKSCPEGKLTPVAVLENASSGLIF
jgi:hypothetical protein